MNLYWQLAHTKNPTATIDDVVREIVKKNPISESTASTVALEQVLTDMAMSIHNTFGDAQTDEERKELKKIWSDKIKEIEKNLKKVTESYDNQSSDVDYDDDWNEYMIYYSNHQLRNKNLQLFYLNQDTNWATYEIKQIDDPSKPLDLKKYKSLGTIQVMKTKDDP